MNQFGERIRQLREQNKWLQRQVAYKVEIDTPLLSKIERGERSARKELVMKLADAFKTDRQELLTLWLADKVYEVVKDEDNAPQVLKVAEEQVKYNSLPTQKFRQAGKKK